MSAEILSLGEARAARDAAEAVVPAERDDMVVAMLAGGMALWIAWPVSDVDDDGIVLAITTPRQRRTAVTRVCSEAMESLLLRRADHDPVAFDALRWKTWSNADAAEAAFAAVRR